MRLPVPTEPAQRRTELPIAAHLLLLVTFISTWAAMIATGDSALGDFALFNGAAQVLLFTVVVCLPLWRTGRMSWVDIGWPWGLVLIGAHVLLSAPGAAPSVWIVGGIYLVVGLRMGVGALVLAAKTGEIVRTELPRYRYRQEMLEREGSRHILARKQLEVINQGLANASVLSVPAALVLADPAPTIGGLTIAGLTLWAIGYVVENIADTQKLLFIRANPGALCDVGLWRYSRHPNHFGEWLVWCGLALVAVPSLVRLWDPAAWLPWVGVTLGLVTVPVVLYATLVYLTGARPAEHYSVQKRPGYAAYQRTTSVLVPLPRRADPRPEAPDGPGRV